MKKFITVSLAFLMVFLPLSPLNAQTQSVSTAKAVETANKFAKTGHELYQKKDYLNSAINYEKAYKTYKTAVFLDNAVTAYLSHSSNLLHDKDYPNAIIYSEKVLSLKPSEKYAKEILSEIYFSRGADYFYTGELEKAKADVEKSIKYAVDADQTERGEDALKKISEAVSRKETPTPKYSEVADASISDTLTKVENKLYGTNYNSEPVVSRVNRLENDVLGKSQSEDSLIVRVDKIKKAVLKGSEYRPQTQNGKPKVYDDTYIHEIIEQSEGRVSVFGKMPVSIFFLESRVKPYKDYYKEAVKAAMDEWSKASDGVITFEIVNNPAKADIQIGWSENFEDFPWKPALKSDDVDAEKERAKYKKASTAVQVGSVVAMVAGGLVGIPVVGGLGALGNSVASPILQYKGTKFEKLSPDVLINTKNLEGLSQDEAKAKIKQVAMHQIGHALGVFGHSEDPGDIMFENFKVDKLSERDINSIREIYKEVKAKQEKKPKSKWSIY